MDRYYYILGLEPGATQQEIKKAYRSASQKLHPDKDPSPWAATMLKQVKEAYSKLKIKKQGEEDRSEIEIENCLATYIARGIHQYMTGSYSKIYGGDITTVVGDLIVADIGKLKSGINNIEKQGKELADEISQIKYRGNSTNLFTQYLNDKRKEADTAIEGTRKEIEKIEKAFLLFKGYYVVPAENKAPQLTQDPRTFTP